ncbi:MAG: stage III sporulation protein AF [Bacillota bacterium]
MDTLALWLKKIVLLVLLATVLDLLLPNTELQRYVKLVMGLIILLVILNPILTLVSPHITDEWITLQAAGTGPAMESVDTIAEKGRALRQDLDRRALEEARTRVEELVRRQVETAFGYTVDEVVVEWSREKDGVALAALTVSVRERRDAAEAPRGGEADGGGSVDPVSPVDVRVEREAEREVPVARSPGGQRLPEVEAHLANVLAVEKDRVRVVMDSGPKRQAEAGPRTA